jgi:glucose uptake protein GlcU
MIEYLYISFSILSFGFLSTPLKLEKIKNVDPAIIQTFMSITLLFLCSWEPFLIEKFKISFYGLISGFLWVIMSFLSIITIKLIGITIGQTIWSITNICFGFLIGVIIFKEKFKNYYCPIIGLIIMITGIIIIVISGLKKKNKKKITTYIFGIIFSILTGIMCNFAFISIKIDNSFMFIFTFSISQFLSCNLLFIIYVFLYSIIFKRFIISVEDIKYGSISGFLCGVLWSIGYYLQFLSIKSNLGFSVGFVLIQLSLVISSIIGMFLFKEMPGYLRKFIFAIGFIIIFPGIILLSLFK